MKNEKKKKKKKARGIMIYHALILQQPPRETSITLAIVFFPSPTFSRVLCFIVLFGIIAFAWFCRALCCFYIEKVRGVSQSGVTRPHE